MKKKSNMEDLTGENRGNGEGKSRDGSTTLSKNGDIPQAQAMVVPIGKILPDPYQPRKEFDAVKMHELVENIREHGILQRLIVRPGEWVVEPGRQSSGTGMVEGWFVFNKQWKQPGKAYPGPFLFFKTETEAKDSLPYYVLTAGERRLRAATTLGLTEVPVDLVNTKNVFAVQMSENLMRENLSALAEAEAYKRQVDAGKRPEDIAKELGVSRSTVFTRLALTRLHAPVRTAIVEGKLAVSIATLVAMIPEPKQQEKALKECLGGQYTGPFSFTEAKELIEEEYCKALKDCGFETGKTYEGTFADGELKGDLKQRGPCTTCPRRTGNMLEEFPDLKARPNVCTQPSCFAAKVTASREEQAAKARAEGKVVIDTKTAVFSKYGGYERGFMDAKDSFYWKGKYQSYQQVLGKDLPEAQLAVNREGHLVKVWRRAAVTAAMLKNGINPNGDRAANTAAYAKQKEKKKKLEAVAGLIQAKAFSKLLAMPCDEKTERKLWTMAVQVLSESYYSETDIEKLVGVKEKNINDEALLKKLPLATVRAAAVAMLTGNGPGPVDYNGDWTDEFELLCEVTGVDLKAEEKAVPVSSALKTGVVSGTGKDRVLTVAGKKKTK